MVVCLVVKSQDFMVFWRVNCFEFDVIMFAFLNFNLKSTL